VSLTDRQREVYLFIVDYKTKHGKSPSFCDIGKHFGFASPNAVTNHLRALETKGLIRQFPGKYRAIKLLVT
jgi:repressor LexA